MGYGTTLAKIKTLAIALKEFYIAIGVSKTVDQIKLVRFAAVCACINTGGWTGTDVCVRVFLQWR